MNWTNRFRKFIRPATAISFCMGAAMFGIIGWFIPSPLSPMKFTGGVVRESADTYQYISPLLACDIGSQEAFMELAPLKASLTKIIADSESSGKAKNVSVYFRSMKGTHWFDINPDVTYTPASLLKIFIMMAYYKEADQQDNPQLLQKQVTFQNTLDATDVPGEVIPRLTPGKSYSVNDLIVQLIKYSDNDALGTLSTALDPQGLQALNNIFSDLQITSLLQKNAPGYSMPVDQYAMVFRVLYGATYLSRNYSEQALSLLAQAHYSGGLVAGVPAGTPVAHKFGISSQNDDQELHDCGIVYYPNHPYLLCVMTRGSNPQDLQGVIQDISAAAYKDVARRHPAQAGKKSMH